MADLLDELKSNDISVFSEDFSQLIRITLGVSRDYRKSHQSINDYLPNYEILIKVFMKKYHNIQLKLDKDFEKIKLRIFLKDNIKNCFKTALRINGLKSIGLKGFDEVQVTDQKVFSEMAEGINDKIYLTYIDAELDTTTILLTYTKKQKTTEIIFDIKLVSDINRPEFKLIGFYAINAYQKNMDLQDRFAQFSFYDTIIDDRKSKWLGDFNPKFLE